MRRILVSLASLLIARIVLLGCPLTAQDTAPEATLRQRGVLPTRAPTEPVQQGRASAPVPPSVCNPCLWYAGDFNANNSKANGLSNENDLVAGQNTVYVPFTVPKGKIWNITGAFGIMLLVVDVLDPPQADWSISKDVSAGHAGQVVQSGTSPATFTPLDCNGGVSIFCGPILVKGLDIPLKAGRYWLSVVPYCTNPNDHNCASARYFLADVEDHPPHNHYGPPDVWGDSFFTSSRLGDYYQPAAGVCGNLGCDMFSMGLLGTVRNDPEP